jgi:LPS O-antigen subunit length determinant protein (WzzB/FepE family)
MEKVGQRWRAGRPEDDADGVAEAKIGREQEFTIYGVSDGRRQIRGGAGVSRVRDDRQQQDHVRGQSSRDEDIDLLDLWQVLEKRKLLILGTTFASAVAASVVAFLMPPTFESRAAIQVGQVAHIGQAGIPVDLNQATEFRQIEKQAEARQIEKPQVLIERLKQEYRVGERNPPNPLPRVESVAAVDRTNLSGLVEIKAHARRSEESQAFLRKVTDDVLQEHRRRFAQIVGLQREERGRLAAVVMEMQEEAARFSRELEKQSTRSDALAALVLLERARRQSELNALRSQIAQWDLLLSPANTYETRLILEPTRPVSPVKPKKALIIVLAGVIGLFLGVFLAFVGASRSRARA